MSTSDEGPDDEAQGSGKDARGDGKDKKRKDRDEQGNGERPGDEGADAESEEPAPVGDSFVWIERYRGGDSSALGKLMEIYQGRVEKLVRSRMGKKLARNHDIGDVVQGVFLRLLKSAKRVERRANARLIDYVARLVQFELANLARHDRTKRRDRDREVSMSAESASGSSAAIDPAASQTGASSAASRTELILMFHECLAKLAEDQRLVIELRDFAGYDLDYVARRLRRSKDAAVELHRRALGSLRRCLMQQPGFEHFMPGSG